MPKLDAPKRGSAAGQLGVVNEDEDKGQALNPVSGVLFGCDNPADGGIVHAQRVGNRGHRVPVAPVGLVEKRIAFGW